MATAFVMADLVYRLYRPVYIDSFEGRNYNPNCNVLTIGYAMSRITWLVALLISGIFLRIGMSLIAVPQGFPDTGTYINLAQQLRHIDFSSYEGRRTPGYPIVLIMANFSPAKIWLWQMIAGLAVSVCLFTAALKTTNSGAVGFVSGMAYNLNLSQMFFESALLPETFSTFFLLLTVALLPVLREPVNVLRDYALVLLLVGTLAGLAIMFRPQFVFLPVIMAGFVGWTSGHLSNLRWPPLIMRMVVVFAPGIILVLGWCSFNFFNLNSFTLSTQTGIGLTEHTIAFIELAPSSYATEKEILIRHRRTHVAETGRHTATWDAVPDLRKATGFSQAELDRDLLKMSIAVISSHPIRYLKLVSEAWVSFWLVSNPPGIQNVNSPAVRRTLETLWHIEHIILRGLNGVFLALMAVVVLSRRARALAQWDIFQTTVVALIICSSVLQALLVGVDNTRYGVTVEPLIVFALITTAYRFYIAPSRSISHTGLLSVVSEPTIGGSGDRRE